MKWRCVNIARGWTSTQADVYKFETVDHHPMKRVRVEVHRDRMLWSKEDSRTLWRAPREMMRAVYAVAAYDEIMGTIVNVPAYELGVHINW